MNILAIDTSMQACSVAVLIKNASEQAQLSGCYKEIERGHAERLMAMIDEVLKEAHLTISQIDQFAVCRGPGTFTGVRIGIATARGLALARKKPLIGVGSLQVLAARVLFERPELACEPEGDLGIAVDARRGEIYWQLFDMSGQPFGEPEAVSPQSIAKLISRADRPITLAGSGACLISALLDNKTDQFTCTHPTLQPDAARLVEIAAHMPEVDISAQRRVNPLYLRPADAKIQSGYAIERQ